MSAPTEIVKSAIQPGKIVGLLIGGLVIAIIADAAGLTNWLLFPFSTAKAKWGKKAE